MVDTISWLDCLNGCRAIGDVSTSSQMNAFTQSMRTEHENGLLSYVPFHERVTHTKTADLIRDKRIYLGTEAGS